MTLPLSRSQTLGVSSRAAQTARFPSGLTATAKTQERIELTALRSTQQESGSHTFSALSKNACVSVSPR